MHARSLQGIAGPPAYLGGRTLHQEEGLFFQAAHLAVIQSSLHRHRHLVLFLMPAGIIIPGHNVDFFLQPVIVYALEKVHKVRCRRPVGILRHRTALHPAEIADLV